MFTGAFIPSNISFELHRRNKVLQVGIDTRGSMWWLRFNFWMNYPFNSSFTHIKSLSTSQEHQTSQNTASTDAAGAVKTDLAPLYTHLLRIALPLCLNLSQEVFWWTHIQWNIKFPSVHLVFAHRWTIITENYIKQGSRVRPIWSHVRPNFSRVRLKKNFSRTGASSHSRKQNKSLRDSESLSAVRQQTR